MPLENKDKSIPASNEQSEAIAPEDALKEVEKASEIAESLEQIEAKDQKSALEKVWLYIHACMSDSLYLFLRKSWMKKKRLSYKISPWKRLFRQKKLRNPF